MKTRQKTQETFQDGQQNEKFAVLKEKLKMVVQRADELASRRRTILRQAFTECYLSFMNAKEAANKGALSRIILLWFDWACVIQFSVIICTVAEIVRWLCGSNSFYYEMDRVINHVNARYVGPFEYICTI
jgi:hypothetical protein